MKRSKLFSIPISLICVCALSGCYPSGEAPVNAPADRSDGTTAADTDPAVSMEEMDLAENIAKKNDNITLSLKYPENEPSEVTMYTTRLREWSGEFLKSSVLPEGCEITEHITTTPNYFGNGFLEVFSGQENGDEFHLISDAGRLEFEYRTLSDAHDYRSLASSIDASVFERLFDSDTIALFSKEDAIARANAALEQYGLGGTYKLKVYGITADKANIALAPLNSIHDDRIHGHGKWTEADEVYFLEYQPGICSSDVADKSTVTIVNDDPSFIRLDSKLRVIVSKDKILSVNAAWIYSDERTPSKTVRLNYSAEDAVTIVVNALNTGLAQEFPYDIYNVYLGYLPTNEEIAESGEHYSDKNVTMFPVWVVEAAVGKSDDWSGTGDGMDGYNRVFVDAMTGKILEW